jgi:hypothetical protein
MPGLPPELAPTLLVFVTVVVAVVSAVLVLVLVVVTVTVVRGAGARLTIRRVRILVWVTVAVLLTVPLEPQPVRRMIVTIATTNRFMERLSQGRPRESNTTKTRIEDLTIGRAVRGPGSPAADLPGRDGYPDERSDPKI